MSTKYLFKQVIQTKGGFLRGPFGGDLKKEIFVEQGIDTYKVYEQGVVLNSDKRIGRYYISEKDYKAKLHKFSVQDKDFLVSCSGVNMGAIYQIKEPFERGIINQALLRIRLNTGLIDDNYFYYLFKELISRKITSGSGDSTIPNFPGLDLIKNIEFELPLKNIQIKIGSILKNIDSKIELNNHINAELESMAKTLYDYWFVQFDFPFDFAQGKPDSNGKPYKSSGGKMVWNEELKREIPESWKMKKLGNLGEFKNGINYDPSIKGNTIARIINVRNISSSSWFVSQYDLDAIVLKGGDVANYLVTDKDILIARSGIPGATRIMYEYAQNTIYCGFIIRYQVDDLKNKNYLFFCLKDMERSTTSKSAGTIMQNVNQETLKRMSLVMPDKNLLSAFNNFIAPVFRNINNNLKENQQLSELRDWLLPMLMNGQVTVGSSAENKASYVIEEEMRMAAEPEEKLH